MDESQRLARVRVRGYALAMCKQVPIAKRTLDVAVDALNRARLEAEELRDELMWLIEQAELASRVASSGDDEWIAEVAGHLEECFG